MLVLGILHHYVLYHVLGDYVCVCVSLLRPEPLHDAVVFFLWIVRSADVWFFGALLAWMANFSTDETHDFFGVFEIIFCITL